MEKTIRIKFNIDELDTLTRLFKEIEEKDFLYKHEQELLNKITHAKNTLKGYIKKDLTNNK